ncbi:MAG: hypothetical protein WCS77_08005 [Elusimicrobiaceae bacterium]|jgi:hypothetical protein
MPGLVREIIDVENCMDGAMIKKYVLSIVIDEKLINYLSALGTFEFHQDFARPFFKVQDAERFEVKGIAGNDYLRVVIYKTNPEASAEDLRLFLDKYTEG